MTDSTCVSAGCHRPTQARNLCTTHWSQWYRANRKRKLTCQLCGSSYSSAVNASKFCSATCAAKNASNHVVNSPGWANYQARVAKAKKPRPPQKIPADTRRPFRVAVEEGDWGVVQHLLEARASKADSGCWEWPGRIKQGYGIVRIGDRDWFVHRLMSQAVHGASDSEPVVHHKCANRKCFNPEHIMPVTQRDNVAEMMARNYYERRIEELERALIEIDPSNPSIAAQYPRHTPLPPRPLAPSA